MSDTFMAFVEETARAAEKRGEERGKKRAGARCAIRLILNGFSETFTSHVSRTSDTVIGQIQSLVTAGFDEDAIMEKLAEADLSMRRNDKKARWAVS